MSANKRKHLTEKHGPDAKPDEAAEAEISKHVKDHELPCAVAFQIAKDMGMVPAEIGKTADLLSVRLVKCQMGLFGYKPDSKITKPRKDVSQELKDAIQNALVNDRLPCKSAWEIASRFAVSKMTVSGVCEAEGIKIKPCQLGAF